MRRLFCFLYAQLQRESLINFRQPKTLFYAVLFFVMTTLFFPLTLSPDPELLRRIAPGLLWIALLFSLIMASERLFHEEYTHGVIEQWLLHEAPLALRVFAKVAVHWFYALIPLLLLCPWLAVVFSLSAYETLVLGLGFLLATPAILLLCALACAFSTSMAQRGIFMALAVWPLALPVMIFGSLSLQAAMQGLSVMPYLAIITAMSLLCALFLPLATGAVIRISLAN